MLGKFLELSLHAPAILESIEWWEKLGFRQLDTNDVWRHPYAVVSDGRAIIGLHQYPFESPALTFVRPGLADALPALRAAGVEFAFAKTGDDEYHEAGFLSPDGQMIALLESRTHSPPAFDESDFSVGGELDALHLPARRIDRSLPFWARLGLTVLDYDEAEPPAALLAHGALRLRLSEDPGLKAPLLAFRGGERTMTSPEGLAVRL